MSSCCSAAGVAESWKSLWLGHDQHITTKRTNLQVVVAVEGEEGEERWPQIALPPLAPPLAALQLHEVAVAGVAGAAGVELEELHYQEHFFLYLTIVSPPR